MTMLSLADKTVLITGASSGIGAATARAMVAAGARVALVARGADRLAALASELGAARAAAFPADVGESDAVAAMAAAVTERLRTPDVLVNNAGAGRFLFLEETEPAELQQMTAVPYHASFYVTRAFLPAMIARGSGRVVMVNTPAAYAPWAGAAGYAGARWALRGLTEALRLELRGTGVGVTNVVPGKVSSEYFAHNPGAEQRIPRIAKAMRTLTPEQVARIIVRAVQRERADVFAPPELWLSVQQARLAPRLTRWVLAKTGPGREP